MALAEHDYTTSKRPSRRGVLALVGAAMATPAVALASTVDEPLVALELDYRRAQAVANEACAALDQQELAAKQAYPRRPLAMYYRVHNLRADGTTGITLRPRSREDIVKDWQNWRRNWGKRPGGHEASLRVADRWEAACRAVDEAYGVPALDAALDRAHEREDALLEQLITTPPRTLRGIFIKLRLAREWSDVFDDPPESQRLLASVLDAEPAFLGRA